jgi:hypothetical protein
MKSMALVKRGTCTFVEKARLLDIGGADMGVVINSDETLMEIPAGKPLFYSPILYTCRNTMLYINYINYI